LTSIVGMTFSSFRKSWRRPHYTTRRVFWAGVRG
jgi:hypothetical protein